MIHGTIGAHKNNVRCTALILDSRTTISSSHCLRSWLDHGAGFRVHTQRGRLKAPLVKMTWFVYHSSHWQGLCKDTAVILRDWECHLRRLKMLFLLELLSAVLKPIKSLAFSSSTCCWRLLSAFPSVAFPRESEPEAGFNRSFSFIIYLFGDRSMMEFEHYNYTLLCI